MKPYDKGFEDFHLGNIENPFRSGTSPHRDWECGFNKAYFNNLNRTAGNEETQDSSRSRSQEVHTKQTA